MKKKVLKISGALLSAVLLLVGISSNQDNLLGKESSIKEANANGTCCMEYFSLCIVDGQIISDAFYQGDGPCPTC